MFGALAGGQWFSPVSSQAQILAVVAGLISLALLAKAAGEQKPVVAKLHTLEQA
jgi:hypothetical protein